MLAAPITLELMVRHSCRVAAGQYSPPMVPPELGTDISVGAQPGKRCREKRRGPGPPEGGRPGPGGGMVGGQAACTPVSVLAAAPASAPASAPAAVPASGAAGSAWPGTAAP